MYLTYSKMAFHQNRPCGWLIPILYRALFMNTIHVFILLTGAVGKCRVNVLMQVNYLLLN